MKTTLDREQLASIARGCIGRKLRMLNRVVSSAYDEALRPHGLKVSQMNVLVAVALLAPVSPAEVARRLALEKSTLSRNLERLLASGWVERVAGDDARTWQVSPTRAGRELLAEVQPGWRAAQRRVRELLGDEAVAAIERAVDGLAELPEDSE